MPERYEAATEPPTAGPAPAIWWEGFGDPALARAVEQTLLGNGDLAIANARVAQAQAVLAGAQADSGPRIELNAGVTAARNSLGDPSLAAGPGGVDRNTRTSRAGANLIWEWDVFGRKAQALSASQQRLLSREAALSATALTVASEAAGIVIEIRTLQQRHRLASATLAIDSEAAEVAVLRFNAGLESQLETVRLQALVRGSGAELQQLNAALAQARRALAVLAGVTPRQVDGWLGTAAERSGAEVPLQEPGMAVAGVPSDLLRRRPDLVQAQAELAAASADLAAVAAERWPRFNLAASLGWVAASAASLGTANALAASLAPAVTWTAWDMGGLQARIEQQTAQEQEAVARLQQSVMQAFAEAETAMKQIEQRRAEVAERELASQAAAQAQQLAQSQFKTGLTDWAKTLDARRTHIGAQSAEALARQQQALAHVTLYRALGGGWPSMQR